MLAFLHVEGLDKTPIVSKCNILPILTYWNRSDTYLLIAQDRNPFFFIGNIPKSEKASLIARQDLNIIGMHNSTVNRSILFQCAYLCFFPEIKNPQKSIFTSCIYNLIMLTKTYSCNITFKMNIKRSLDCITSCQIINTTSIIHTYN